MTFKNYGLYVGGHKVKELPQWITVINPATLEPVGRIPEGNESIVNAAIDAATKAFPEWAATPAKERARLLKAAAQRMMEDIERIARILTSEQGKPLVEARGEVTIAADYLEWSGEEAKRIYGEIIPASTRRKRLQVIRQPVGVVGAITPWNFPASMVTRKIGPALAAGCTVVLKPASATPLTAAALFDIFHEVGFPPGTVNLVTGNARMIANQFLNNQAVRKVSFTGSTQVGRSLITGAAGQIKKLSLELGGHAPFLVFDDADVDKAVEGVIASKYRNAGQTCICANRLYVQSGIADVFEDKLIAAVRSLRVGNGLEPDIEVGPLIDEASRNHVVRQVEDAIARGGRVVAGGSVPSIDLPGAFYTPTLIANVPDDALLTKEETFGPLIGIRRFDTEEEALRLANDTEYGLAAYAYTKDFGRITRVSEALEYGIVGINDPVPTVVQAPFGGVKESGWGREGGWQGMDAYLETKFVSISY
ncbi:NAD-dependent succinate-semialdehyde dehydrogenase [Alicyclobacillus dauci]|uniref:NAD-dependent succinate-semialdehyde dehydrogenase n=1 Tax=Alicyclobacillus dauci TaxID=1475485 RepID=UPI002DD43F84|nr:NAD-dependent succinate-semialdehyde dehydrogenase [Alicyclobacillus dauci]